MTTSPSTSAENLEKQGHQSSLTAADELFDSGIIRPLNPIPKHQIKESTRDRGRERPNSFSPSISHPHSRSRKGSRSLSPLRRGTIDDAPDCLLADKSPTSPAPSAAKGTGGSRKWRLRDLLLFRSASEGRATGNQSKDPLRKYTLLTSSPTRGLGGEDPKNSSFRSTASNGARPPARSAHEKHYTANRAAAEELKKKTALPYRQGLFGCLRFNPAVNSIARGFSNQSFNHRR
ncbi:uncharacterized protein LOC120263013 [Dioscorea cayenensis subsp. rotundata]|uniref:Uncharacterized protein LOC120263013 n=1 Tax=Dioscorea cayennensis subsp. rotundata TaxID=55577 RepID=A0AB40BJS1_DIOCR|nr:uncharacterized protein LOC120263013 [Dioscorea cayenensis subsp. rotundata]